MAAGWGFRAAGKAMSYGNRAGHAIGESLDTRVALHRASRGARRGFLGPGDPTPPGTAGGDYYDYRGVATWREARHLTGGEFPLGGFVDISSGVRVKSPIGLPAPLLNRHAMVVGPTGSGKTYSLLVPWIDAALAAGWSAVVVDVVGNLLDKFHAYREQVNAPSRGAGLVRWDFMDPRMSTPWDWIAALSTDVRTDAAVTAILGRREQAAGTDPYFYQRDRRTLRGLLMFARAALPQLRTPSELLRTLEDDIALEALVRQHPRAPGAADLAAALAFPSADYPKVISGVVTALAPLATRPIDQVTRASAARPSLDLARCLDEHQLTVVGAPLQGGQISATLSGLFLNQLAQRMYERFQGGARPTLLVIDECPQVVDRVDVAQMMEVARGAGIGVVVAMQDLMQIAEARDRSSMESNAATFVLFPGASSGTVEAFGKRLGHRFETTHSVSMTGGRTGRGTTQSMSTESVPVLRDRELLHPPFGERPATVHLKTSEMGFSGKPFLVDLHRV